MIYSVHKFGSQILVGLKFFIFRKSPFSNGPTKRRKKVRSKLVRVTNSVWLNSGFRVWIQSAQALFQFFLAINAGRCLSIYGSRRERGRTCDCRQKIHPAMHRNSLCSSRLVVDIQRIHRTKSVAKLRLPLWLVHLPSFTRAGGISLLR